MKQCRKCRTTNHAHFYKQDVVNKRTSVLCRVCAAERAGARLRAIKLAAIEYKGGKCEGCGYNRCPAALVFHHRDPAQKDPEWTKLRGKRLELIKQELDKCDLLCGNCHAEVHYCYDCV